MSRLVLATANTDFEQRVRDAFGGELNGPLRYWRDDMLVDPEDAVRELGGRGVEVVALGPDMPDDVRSHSPPRSTRPSRHQRRDHRPAVDRPPAVGAPRRCPRRDRPRHRAGRPAGCDRAGVRHRDPPPAGVRRRRRRRRRRRPRPRGHGAVPEGRRREDHDLDQPRPRARAGGAGRSGDPRPRRAVRRRRQRARPAPRPHASPTRSARSTSSTPPRSRRT